MKVFQVGGSVRDELLGVEPKDRDWVVVNSSPEEMEKNSNLDKCIWILEDHDYIQRSGDRTWPLSPFKCENVTFLNFQTLICQT